MKSIVIAFQELLQSDGLPTLKPNWAILSPLFYIYTVIEIYTHDDNGSNPIKRKGPLLRQHCRLTLWKYDCWTKRNTHNHQISINISIRTKDTNNHSAEAGTMSNFCNIIQYTKTILGRSAKQYLKTSQYMMCNITGIQYLTWGISLCRSSGYL